MNWNCTDVHNFHIKWKRLPFAVAICLILVCVTPLASCWTENEEQPPQDRLAAIPDNSDLLSNHNGIHFQHHRRKSPSNSVNQLKGSSNGPQFHGTYRTDEKDDEKYRNKLNEGNERYDSHSSYVDGDPNKSKHYEKDGKNTKTLNYLESDKKYFDYFPIEDIQFDYDPKDDIDVILLADEEIANQKKKKSKKFSQNERKHNSRRAKRDLSNTVNDFLESERGNPVRRSVGYNVGGQTITLYQGRGSFASAYLPPQVHQAASVTFIKYPIPGVYYNPISPAGNYRPKPVPKPSPGGTPIGDRFGGEDETDRVVWDIVYTTRQPSKLNRPESNNPQTPSNSLGPNTVSGPNSTRRPAPPLIHGPVRNRNSNDRAALRPNTSSSSGFGGNTINRQEFSQNPTTQSPPIREPTKCVWAIVSCCARNNPKIRYECFEQLGCHGAFWDLNPCADEFQDAAIKEAELFFDK